MRVHGLQRDESAGGGAGEVYLAHAAVAEQRDEAVPADLAHRTSPDDCQNVRRARPHPWLRPHPAPSLNPPGVGGGLGWVGSPERGLRPLHPAVFRLRTVLGRSRSSPRP
ncbi:hypothetical protein GCM10010278_20200 [Streptomyces melanogenes]|nr:hypothetical protein GCM10010278_20200 [Streptomyces melanogenes]